MPHLYLKADRQDSRFVSSWTVSEVVRIRLWHVAWVLLFRVTPKWLNPWRLFLLRLFGAKTSGKPFVYPSARVFAPFLLRLDHRACLGPESELYNLGPVHVMAHATVAQQVYVCNGTHDFSDVRQPLLVGRIVIGKGAFIGARAFIMPGVAIGEGALVGACAVVTKDVSPWTVVAGNPAKRIRERPQMEIE